MDFIWKIFPYVFGVMFVIGLVYAVCMFTIVAFTVFSIANDPTGFVQDAGSIMNTFMKSAIGDE